MMVRTLTAVLLAATAMVPSIAAAQDDGRGERWGDRREAGREQRDDRGQRDDRRGDRVDNRGDARVEPRAVPQARPEVRQDARPDARHDDRARPGRDGRYQDNRPALIERQRMIEAQRRERVVPAAPQPGRDLHINRRDDTPRNDQRNWRDNDRRSSDGLRAGNNRRGDNDDRWRGNRHADNDRWDRNWRNDRRYGWQDYRSSNRHVYRVPRYNGPRGYSYDYRRWSPGYQIQSYFYDQRYWITDPFYYRLPDVWGPYRWVRYYDDVLLVDIRNGMIVDTIYDFFWQ